MRELNNKQDVYKENGLKDYGFVKKSLKILLRKLKAKNDKSNI